MDPTRRRDLTERLREMFPEGSPLPGTSDGEFLDIRERDTEAVLIARWARDPHLYGIPVDLTDTRREYYYRSEVDTDEEWLDSVGLGLMVALNTGFRSRARRRRVEDYIELRADAGWPEDRRFYFHEPDEDFELLAAGLREDGLDPSAALEARAQGSLLAWLLAYENNSTGCPWVGHAFTVGLGDGSAVLPTVETVPGTPDVLRLDLAYFTAHSAAARGARSIRTSLPDKSFVIAGFRHTATGRSLDTSFLDADPDAARAMLEADIQSGSRWGDDRDEAGRYLPNSRLRRLVHLARWGLSGRSAARKFRVG